MKPFKITNDQDREEFIKKLRAVKLNKPYIAQFKVVRKPRSLRQNKLYRLWLAAIEDQTGNADDFMHHYFRGRYLGYEEKEAFGRTIKKLKSTTSLDTKQFTAYLDDIYLEMSEEGIELVRPDEYRFAEFYEYYKDMID